MCCVVQGVFKQLQAFNDSPRDTVSPVPDLQQADPLNIISVALARQQAAVQAGCSDTNTCADSTNLVNTLYQRHQALLQRTQPLLDRGQADTVAVHPATAGPAKGVSPDSLRSFQGDTVPDTPVADQAAEVAAAGTDTTAEVAVAEADAAADKMVFSVSPQQSQPGAAAHTQSIEMVFEQDTAHGQHRQAEHIAQAGLHLQQSVVPATTSQPDTAPAASEQAVHHRLDPPRAELVSLQAQAGTDHARLTVSPNSMQQAFQV